MKPVNGYKDLLKFSVRFTLRSLCAVGLPLILAGMLLPSLCMAQEAEEQELNQINTIDLTDPNAPRIISVTPIPPENFRVDPTAERAAVETTPSEEQPKIHPRLQEQIKREAPDSIVEVIITFREDQKLPRLPALMPHQSRASPTNQAMLKKREALIEDLTQRRKSSRAEFIHRLEPLDLAVLEEYWLINGVLAQLPIASVEAVAAQPEVQYISPRIGEETLPRHDTPENDVIVGRTQMQSDSYFDAAEPSTPEAGGAIAVLDSGVRASHVLLNNPSHLGVIRDCVHGSWDINHWDHYG